MNCTEHVPFANPFIDVPTTLQVFGVLAVMETLPPFGTVSEYFFMSEVLLIIFPRAKAGALDPELTTGDTAGTIVEGVVTTGGTEGTVVAGVETTGGTVVVGVVITGEVVVEPD